MHGQALLLLRSPWIMKDRFEQSGLDMYSNLQDLLLLAANGKDYSEQLKAVSTFYRGDFEITIENLFCYVWKERNPDFSR